MAAQAKDTGRHTPAAPDCLAGGGEMGALMRAHAWERTRLGAPHQWSASLRMMVSFLLANRFPLLLWWGPDYICLYNDAYRPVLGGKHPQALGQPCSECWSEIWHVLKPLIDTPFTGGPSTWMEDIELEVQRHGYREETHFTIAYSPVPDETAPHGIGGVLATVHEITEAVIGRRRVGILSELGSRLAGAKTAELACIMTSEVLAGHSKDVPFAVPYLIDAGRRRFLRAGEVGIAATLAGPSSIDTESAQARAPWPLALAARTESPQVVTDLPLVMPEVPQGPRSDAPHQAVVVPIKSHVANRPAGVVVFGVSAGIRLDAQYLAFFDLLAVQMSTAIANAREYEAERQRAESFAELDRAKTIFFSNVSHEFRTPLTLMLGPLEEAAADGSIQPQVRAQLELAHRNSVRLLKLVNSLLDFSRIEAGRMQACYEPLDLAALTRDVASTFRSAMERAGLAFSVDCAELGEAVYVDRDMWEKIVLNLLSNAFKFTLAGSISVRVAREAAQCLVEVNDTGCGIAAAEMPRLFERFRRIEGAEARTQEGTGIGLALVRELVTLQGGHIEVVSEPARGSSFRIRLPFGSAHLPQEQIRAARTGVATAVAAEAFVQEALRWIPTRPGDTFTGLALVANDNVALPDERFAATFGARIVLADDNADMRAYLSGLLSPMYLVEEVSDGEQALAAARRQTPDLILSDIMMPRLDGLSLLKALRSDPALRSVPIILLSARAGEEARIAGLDAGADDYLVKPFGARELLARIGALLELTRLRHQREIWLAGEKEAFQAAMNGAPLDVSLGILIRMAIGQLGGEARCAFYIADDAGRELHHVAGMSEAYAECVEGFRIDANSLACGLAMHGGQPIITPDVRHEPRWKEWLWLAERFGYRGCWSFPVETGNGKFVGTFAVYHSSPRDATARDRELAAFLTQAAALIISRHQESEVRKHGEDALRMSAAALRAADRQKDEFLAMLAHELRNPLAPLRTTNELLARLLGSSNPTVSGAVDIAKRQVDQLTRLVDDLLDVSRVTQGRIELQRRPTSVPQIIAQALEAVQPLTREKGHRVSVRALGMAAPYVNADPARLTQCVVNILTNAAKYTDAAGDIEVSVLTDASHVIIRIRDSGVGIAPELLPRIFDLFVQGDRTLDRTQGGLGVGLAVVKRLVEMHDGAVRADSEGPGRGTSFEIRLPLVEKPEKSEAEHQLPAVPVARILVVDDNEDSAESLATLLKLEGHEVQSVYSAADALKRAASFKPEVLLIDIGLPKMDGYQVARKLRELPGLEHSTMIAVTGYGMPDDHARATAAGFDVHLVKPVRLTSLMRAMAGLKDEQPAP